MTSTTSIITLISLMLGASSCGPSEQETSASQSSTPDSSTTVDHSIMPLDECLLCIVGHALHTMTGPVTLLSKEKSEELPSTRVPIVGCGEWDMTAEEIGRVLKLSVPATERDLHDRYDYTQCRLIGRMIYDGVCYEYRIDAGSFVRMYSSDTSFILACGLPECEEYFLHRPWRPEDEEE